MKKCLKSIVLIFMILMLMMAFVACDNPILCKIKFDSNGGSSVNSISTISGKKVVMPDAPTRDGYTFDGWFRDNGVWEKPFTENSLLNTSISENFTVYAKWEEAVSSETNFTFAFNENNAIITGLKDKTAMEVIIPSKVTINNVEYNVISIRYRAFYNCDNLRSITLPSSVISIGNEAFRDCDSLSSIALPSSVTSIGEAAFYSCNSLSSINFPSSLTRIGSEAFYNCSNLRSITLPSSVTSIGDKAFEQSTIIFTDALTKLYGWSFEANYYGCDLNTFATINGISYIVKNGNAIIAYCVRSIETAIIPSKVTINNVEYNVTSIGYRAFYNCSNLSSITLPNSVISIGNQAFSGCHSLSSITLPSSVTSIGDYAFERSTILFTDVLTKPDGWSFEADYYGCDLNTFATINGISYVVKNGNAIAASCEGSLETVIVPSKVTINNVEYNVTNIGDLAFYNCDSLRSITLPSSITSIGNGAFNRPTIVFTDALNSSDGWRLEADYYGCDLNTFATINGISYVVKNKNAIAAKYVGSLESAIIPSKVTINNVEYNVTSIGDWAFYNCDSLSSITLPSSVTSIGRNAFNNFAIIYTDALTKLYGWNFEAHYYGCDLNTFATINGISYVVKNGNAIAASCERSLETVIIPSKATINNVEYNVTSIGNWAFYGCANLTTITLPNSVTSIGDGAFSGCHSLSSITLPNSVISIGNGAFYDCNNLISITLPNSVISIGNGAFYECNNLISITLPNSVTSIGDSTFFSCYSLSSITLPSGVISIGKEAFYNCANLTTITLPNSVTSIGDLSFYNCSNLISITLPSSLTTIGDWTFYNCDSLRSITLPSGVTSIGKEAFSYCSSLRSITLPSSVTSIGDLSFYNCSNLISITLPSGVTSIGDSTFYGCHSLSSITLPNSLTTIGDGAFYECSSLSSITLPSSVISVGWDAFEWSTIVFTDALNSSDGWRIEANYYGCDLNNFATINGISYLVKNGNAIIASCESSLKTVIIPSKVTINNVKYNVTSIGNRAFYNCGSLSIITLPRSVISIGGRAFNSSTIIFTDALTKPDGWSCEADYYGCDLNTFATINGISYVVKKGNAIAASCERSLVTANIPSKVTINNVEYNVTSIGNRAFYGCANLTTITLPRSVTSIGNEAFRDCISLSSITLPSSVTSIGEETFRDCGLLIIYCETLRKPNSWDWYWNCNCPVVWGHK